MYEGLKINFRLWHIAGGIYEYKNMLNLTMINDESLIFTHAHCQSSVDR